MLQVIKILNIIKVEAEICWNFHKKRCLYSLDLNNSHNQDFNSFICDNDLLPLVVKGYRNCNICQKITIWHFLPVIHAWSLFATFLSILCGSNLLMWSINPSHLCLSPAGRIRLNSESHASTVSRDVELQARGEDEAGTPTDGAPFRGRSKSAPPALWAAKKYGRQLRRMSDEFDSLLDKGVRMRREENCKQRWWFILMGAEKNPVYHLLV